MTRAETTGNSLKEKSLTRSSFDEKKAAFKLTPEHA